MRVALPVISALVALAFAVVGCIFVYAQSGLWLTVTYAGMCIVFFPFAVLLHEFGHKLFGTIAGFTVKLKNLSPFAPVASCQVIPRNRKNIKNKLIATAIGGLALNFLFVILGAAAFIGSGWVLMLSFVLPSSLYLFLANVMPVCYDGGKTDTLVIAETAKGSAPSRVLVRVLEIQGMVAEGVPLAEIDENLLFDVPQIAEDEQAFIMLVSLRADYYAAKGDEKKENFWKERFSELKEYLPEGSL